VHGDTGRVLFGMGTYGSRSLAVGGTAIVKALDKIIAKGKKIAAHLLEAAEGDIEFKDGKFTSPAPTEQDVRRDRAHRVRAAQLSARQARAGLERDGVLRSDELHVPAGTHICEVEIDPDTGVVGSSTSRRATTSATSSIR
jgi:carbon-monoxide dehydrogenase large subunit